LVGTNYNGVAEDFLGFRDNIRFSLNLKKVNPFNLIDSIGR